MLGRLCVLCVWMCVMDCKRACSLGKGYLLKVKQVSVRTHLLDSARLPTRFTTGEISRNSYSADHHKTTRLPKYLWKARMMKVFLQVMDTIFSPHIN